MKLLVLNLRGLPASATGPYGNRWIETFTLDTLAASGVVFDYHHSAHPDTETTHQVWRTGRHLFPKPEKNTPSEGDGADLLDVLKELQVTTHLIRDSDEETDFEQGWNEVVPAEDTEEALAATRKWLDDPPLDSWMLWVEVSSLLPPWDVPQEILDIYFTSPKEEADEESEDEEDTDEVDEESIEDYFDEEDLLEPLLDPSAGPSDPEDDALFLRLHKTQAAAISYLDNMLGEVLDGLPDEVWLIVTSNHGLPLGEHGLVGFDRPWLHAEVAQVPLLIVGPGCKPGSHVRAITSSIDLAPTIAELAGGSLKNAHGKSLVPWLGIEQPPSRDYICLGWEVGNEIEWAIRTSEWHLRINPSDVDGLRKLYSKPADRFEMLDLRQQNLERAESLEKTLRAFVESCDQPGEWHPPELKREE